jgi:hypothetical protein
MDPTVLTAPGLHAEKLEERASTGVGLVWRNRFDHAKFLDVCSIANTGIIAGLRVGVDRRMGRIQTPYPSFALFITYNGLHQERTKAGRQRRMCNGRVDRKSDKDPLNSRCHS